MENFDKEKFRAYLSSKVAKTTGQIYASDMAVTVNAFKKMKLYKNKELKWILEDFLSHKKAVKNYLQDEFLSALAEVGSNDSGLYDSLSSKAKHYLSMLEGDTSPDNALVSAAQADNNEEGGNSPTIENIDSEIIIKLSWESQDSFEEGELEKEYSIQLSESFDTAYDAINLASGDQSFLDDIVTETAKMFNDKFIIQLYCSYAKVADQEYTSGDYIDGDDEYYELSACRFFFPDGNENTIEFFMRD